jgi:hypothetical protein
MRSCRMVPPRDHNIRFRCDLPGSFGQLMKSAYAYGVCAFNQESSEVDPFLQSRLL